MCSFNLLISSPRDALPKPKLGMSFLELGVTAICTQAAVNSFIVYPPSEPILPPTEGRVETHFFAVLQDPIQRHLRATDRGEAGPRVEHG